ncbi:MAG: hypothetical protein WC783_00340 [Candidatus Paceibacterota bacterium]|jgi:hypothetical protein
MKIYSANVEIFLYRTAPTDDVDSCKKCPLFSEIDNADGCIQPSCNHPDYNDYTFKTAQEICWKKHFQYATYQDIA